MDKLDSMFKRQQELQKRLDIIHNDDYIKEMILACIVELTELLQELNWKSWKKTDKKVDDDKIRTEISDILHFFINISLYFDINSSMLYEDFMIKNKLNIQRHKDGY